MFLKKGTDPTKAHSRASVVTFGYMTQIDEIFCDLPFDNLFLKGIL